MPDELARLSHALLTQALELEAPSREEFLKRSCAGEPALAERVRRLIAAVDRSAGFLEHPAVNMARSGGAARPAAPPSSIRIPSYSLVRVIGVGGMATVYEAVQRQPERTVALKVMNRGLGSASAVRRFQYETEVLARLQHPGIAQIFEAGTCEDGVGVPLPYFAMELIAGARTLTDYAVQQALPLRQRLELFAAVCDAVQHGHQLGVIHRDLKPGNILVDEAGRTKIIDFGIARPVDAAGADLTQRTAPAQLIGTLNYMSPEQCAGASVDVRTDVYALGVVLYQLIADRQPHDLARVALPEAARIIAHAPPTRLGSLVPAARGDLESIVQTAMAKDPARRYASAAALAADIRRFQNCQPIDARPATTLYQLRMFARRHRPLVLALSAVFVALAAGVVTTSTAAVVAFRARTAAEQREHELEQVVAYQESQLAGIDVAELGRGIRRALLTRATQPASQPDGAAEPGGGESTSAKLDRLLSGVNFTSLALEALYEHVLLCSRYAIDDQFANQPLVRARLLLRLAGTMHRLGLSGQAEPLMIDALAIRREALGDDHPDTLQASHALGALLGTLGRDAEALPLLDDAYRRLTRLRGPGDDQTLRAGTSLGGVLRQLGRLDEAERIWSQTLAARRRMFGDDDEGTLRALSNMGIIQAMRGDYERAEASWRELAHRRRALGEDHPDYRNSLINLGAILHERGKLDEARPAIEAALASTRSALGDNHPDTLLAMTTLAQLLIDLEDLDAAETIQRECLLRRRDTLGVDHPRTLLASTTLAQVLVEKFRRDREGDEILAEAQRLARDALDAQRRILGDDHPEAIDSRAVLAAVQLESGQLEDAGRTAAEAVERARRHYPPEHAYVGHYLLTLGQVNAALRRWAQAEDELLEAHAILSAARGPRHKHTRDAAEDLAEFYESWHEEAPLDGHDARAARWRSESAADEAE